MRDSTNPPNNDFGVIVTATDSSGDTSMAMVTIEVTDVNEAPMVMGDASIDHPENSTALNATPTVYTASDPDTVADPGDDLKWTLSGADAGKFELTGSGDTRTLAFEDAPNYESSGDSGGDNVYEVTVVVTDSKRNTDEQDVTVKVTNLEEAGEIELSTLQPRIGFPITATLTDADNLTANSVSWQWYKGNVTQLELGALDMNECVDAGSDRCFIKGATSATYTPVAFDVNDPVVAVALYTDGSPNEADAPTKDFAMMVTANNVLADTRNKAPVFPDRDDVMDGRQTAQERMIAENTAAAANIGGPVVATDSITANDGMAVDETLTYSLGGPDAASFTIHRGTAQLNTKVELDKETKDTYVVMVTATDPSGETATVMVTIKVTNVDEAPEIMRAPDANVAPEFADSEDGARSVAEDTAAGEDIGNPVAAADANGDTLAYTLGGTDAASFDIDSATGQLMTLAALDYETKDSYSVTVTASDSGGLSDSIDVTITVTNEDEMGEVTLWAGTDPLTMAPQVGETITGAVMDPDSGVTGQTWQWAKTKTPAMMDSWMPITDATNSAYMVPADDTGYYLRVMATYTDAVGTDTDMGYSMPTMMVTAMMTVPMFETETATREVAENTAAGMDIGDPVTATDADGDAWALDYTLGGTDAGSYSYIDPETGQLKTLAALDYETKATYEVMVTATDPDSASDMITVTITVTNVEEPGMVTLWAGADALTMAPQVGETITGACGGPGRRRHRRNVAVVQDHGHG